MDARLSWLLSGGIAVFLLWLVFSSAGGGSDPSSTPANSPGAPPPGAPPQTGDRSAIDDVLNRTFTQNDPSQCTQDVTAAYLHQVFGSEKGAEDRCRRHSTPQSELTARSIAVQSVVGGGSRATAVIRLSSTNTLDGSVQIISLVHQGGRWKLDKLVDVQIDRARFDQQLRNELGARGYLPAETSCAVGKLDRTVPSDEIERDIVIGDSSYEYIENSAVSCLSRPTLLREFGEEITAAFRSRGVPQQVTRCVVDRLTHGVPIMRLRHLLAAGSRSAEAWWQLGYQAVQACAGGSAPPSGSSTT